MSSRFLRVLLVKLLEWESRLVLLKYKPRIVMVTGSVGKTSAKDAIYTALVGAGLSVRKSKKSFNSELGVPLTILNCENAWGSVWGWLSNLLRGKLLFLLPSAYPQWLVLEVGADKPGDLGGLLRWLTPDIAVVTRLPAGASAYPDVPVHVEFYASPEAVAQEESLPALALPDTGLLVLNDDDERVSQLTTESRARTLTYGLTPRAAVAGSNVRVVYDTPERVLPQGMAMRVTYKEESVDVEVPGVLGSHLLYPALAACAVALGVGVPFGKLRDVFLKHETPPGRMRLLRGNKNTLIIDDTYNSSPVALREALLTLKSVEGGWRKVAVLGDMKELGPFSKHMHEQIGALAAENCHVLLTVGVAARGIAEGALNAGMEEKRIFQFDDAVTAGNFLEDKVLQEHDLVLIKGSQSMRMERVTEEIMAEPERAGELLVRQEPEWKKR